MRQKFGPILIAAAAFSLLASTVPAAVLFTTVEDYSGFSNGAKFTTTGVPAGSTDSSTTNGAGNTTAPGAIGTSGALQVVRGATAGNFDYFYGPGEQGNAGFFAALGSTLTGSNITAASGNIIFDASTTPTGAGNYLQLGVVLNYDGHFTQLFGTTVDNGNGTSTTTIPYTLDATSLSYFQLGFIFNSDYNPATFIVDNIRTDQGSTPEPASLSILVLGGLAVLRRRRD